MKMSKQDPLSVPLPASPTHLADDGSEVESNLIAAIKKMILEETDFPPLSPPKMKISGERYNNLSTNNYSADATDYSADTTEQMDVTDDATTGYFAKTYPDNYPLDWTLSPANDYQQPVPTTMDAIDSSLASENERCVSLCLPPFSKEFFIATGYSKLQVPDDYLELIRVIVWHNRQRLKMGLFVLSPLEFEAFLHEEMAQDFSDLGIDIEDFLANLIKTHHEEEKSFEIYNNYIKMKSSNSSKIDLPTLLDGKPSPKPNKLKSPQNTTPINAAIPLDGKTTPSEEKSQQYPPENRLKKFVSVTDQPPNTPSHSIDKPIILKNKEVRCHVHRYDLRIGIKECHSDEEEQKLLQNLLEDFFETMLSADKTIKIPPYYELDHSNTTFQDFSSSYRIAEIDSFTKLKRYFSRLGARKPNTGFMYCSCIVASSFPHTALMTQVSQILQESKLSLWPRSCNHENVGRIGWLLYSLQDMDVNRLKTLLTQLTGSKIGVKWMKISMDYGPKWNGAQATDEPTKALVLDGPQDQIYELCDMLSTWYGSKSTSFLDAGRMRLIPPLDALSDSNRHENYGAALAKQASFVSKMGKRSSWEFTSNLILDKQEPSTGLSLRQLIMAIPSSQHPNYLLFHCVNRYCISCRKGFSFCNKGVGCFKAHVEQIRCKTHHSTDFHP